MMNREPVLVIRLGRRAAVLIAIAPLLLAAAMLLPGRLEAQKTQETFKDKLNIATENAGVSVATSADGKYVYVAGGEGILVSDNFGKTGSWTLVLKGK